MGNGSHRAYCPLTIPPVFSRLPFPVYSLALTLLKDISAIPFSISFYHHVFLPCGGTTGRSQLEETTASGQIEPEQASTAVPIELPLLVTEARPSGNGSIDNEQSALIDKFEATITRTPLERGLWHATVESMPGLVLVGDRDGKAVYMNPAYARLVGYGLSASVDLDDHAAHYHLFRPDGSMYDSRDLPMQKAALTGNEVREAEVVHVAANGDEIFTLWNASPIRSSEGKVVGAVAVGRDISEQRKADETKARLAAIVESSQDAIIGKTLDGTITSWNRGAQQLYGYSEEEAIGKPIGLIATPEYAAELLSIHERLRRGERIERFETVRRRKDGTRVEVSVSVSPIAGPDGRITQAATIARDITAQKQAQVTQRFLTEVTSALSASLDYEETLNTVAQLAVPTLADICVVDMIEERSVRQRATSQAGHSYRGCLSQILSRYPLAPESPDPVWDVLRTGEPQIITMLPGGETTYQGGAEALRPLSEAGVQAYMVVPIVIRGRPAGAIALMSVDSRRSYGAHDLALAAELASRAAIAVDNARLYREARDAVSARDEFLSIAAHELRTPLTSLRGFVQLALRQLDRDGKLDPVQARQALRVIDLQSRKLSSLVSQLLDVTRLEAGRLSLERRIVDIGDLIENVVAATAAAGSEHAILARIATPALALVDPVRIEQVVTGLLDNALKFSPPESSIEIDLEHPSRETIRIIVRDHGAGIPEHERGQMFTRFYHTQATEQTGGMGLSLFIGREIVVLHGGTIEADFPESGGSRFLVTLPTGFTDPDSQ